MTQGIGLLPWRPGLSADRIARIYARGL